MPKLVLIGVDGFIPELAELWSSDLPNLMQMQGEGAWGRVKAAEPADPATAWAAIQTGDEPGARGFRDPAYRDQVLFSLPHRVLQGPVKPEPLFRYLYKRGHKVALLNLPFTWPAPRVTGGYAVSCLPPGTEARDYTWPASLRDEITEIAGEYLPELSLSELQNLAPQSVVEQISRVDSQRFALLKHFIKNKECDLIMMAVGGLDLLSHLFHTAVKENSQQEGALHDYYQTIDQEIGEIRAALDEDTALLVLSPYSALEFPPDLNSSSPSEPHGGGHGPSGYFCLAGPGVPADGEKYDVTLRDIFPTVLTLLQMPVPPELTGKAIIALKPPEKETKAAENNVLNRLTMLGY